LEAGGRKLSGPSPTLNPSYSKTPQHASRNSQTLPLTNSAYQIQKSETEFVYLED